MNKKRLLKLAEFLETKVASEHFDLGFFNNEKFRLVQGRVTPGCGAAACAIGWLTVCFPDAFKIGPFGGIEDHEGRQHWHAAEVHFEIDTDQAEWLFLEDSYDADACGRLDVASRIRDFVAPHEVNS